MFDLVGYYLLIFLIALMSNILGVIYKINFLDEFLTHGVPFIKKHTNQTIIPYLNCLLQYTKKTITDYYKSNIIVNKIEEKNC